MTFLTTTRKQLNVTKRSGEVVALDYDKIHNMISWACEGLKEVSASQVATSAHLQFYDKMPTKTIHDTLIQSAVNLITEEAPDYQYVAARLLLVNLRKEAYGNYQPTTLLDQIKKCVREKKYASDLLTTYSEEEIAKIEKFLDYDRDLDFTYAGLREFAESYLVRDKVKKILFETPQQAYAVIAMTIFSVEDVKGELFADEETKKAKRLALIKELYDALSLFRISLPTPIMANCRTPIKQFASCTVIDCGDSIESIFTTSHAIGRYITRGAGIGLNMGRLRGDGTAVRDGLGFSTGCLPFYKLMESTTNSCNQGGIRKGASTVFFPFWHIQAEELIPLKDSRGTETNRIQHLDYAVQLSRLFYDRVKSNGTITLFCPSEVGDLYQMFFEDVNKFEELYLKYEAKKGLNKRTIKAKDLLDLIIRVRSETGRLYIHNVDNTNEYGSYNPVKAPVHQSNLCVAGNTQIKVRYTFRNKEVEEEIEIKDLESLLKKRKRSNAIVEALSVDLTSKAFKKEYKEITNFALMNETADVMSIHTTKDKTITCTPDHEIWCSSKNAYVFAKDLKIGDTLLDINGEVEAVDMTSIPDNTMPVYDITVEGNHNFFANNLLVSNCMEITIPTMPLKSIDDEQGLIGLCTLGAVNLGRIKDLNKDMYASTKILIRSLDNLLEYQQYPIKAAERFGKDYRALGIGVTNLAYYLAKKGLKYASGETLPVVHETFEAMQYYLLKASNELAKERGKCNAYETTKYSDGVLPIDKYKKTVDEICTTPLKQDWEALREEIKNYGLRHTVLSAIMPSEKSSIIGNSTNGIEAPRSLLSIKNNKNSGSIPMVVPESHKLRKNYQLVWGKDYSNKAYINIASIIQKFIDQSISADLYYNPSRYFEELNGDTNAVSKEMYRDLVKDVFYSYKMGLKTLYYSTTRDGSGESHGKMDDAKPSKQIEEEGCPDGVCSI